LKKRMMLLIIAFLLAFTFAAGCNRKQERPAPQENKEKIPQSLLKIQDNAQKVMEEVEKVEEEKKKPAEQFMEEAKPKDGGQQGGGQQDGGQQGGGQQGGGQQSGGGQQGGQQAQDPEAKKEEKITKMWDGITQKIEQMHKSWNEYEVTGIKDGAGERIISGFEEALNNMTIAAQGKNATETLDKANEVSLFAADFLDMYKGNIDGEVERMKYYVRQTYLEAQREDWEMAQSEMEEGGNVLKRLKNRIKLDKKDQNLLDRLELSLEDMRKAIPDRDVELLKIKRDIALQNLDAVKEKAK